MSRTGGRSLAAWIVVVACLLATTLVVAPPVAADGHTAPPPASETFAAEDDVHVWERSFLTLRADAGDAAATIPNADWRVRGPEGDEASLNRDPIPIYDEGSEVTLGFEEFRARKSGVFGDADVEVVRAHVDSVETDRTPQTFSDAIDVLTENGAADATFESVAETQLDDGSLTVSDTPGRSGSYLYFAFTEAGDGVEVSGGDLSVTDAVTVVGVERVDVRSGTGDVSAPTSVQRGENATFDVDASGLSGDQVAQAVVLYDEETYVQQYVRLDATDAIDRDFDLANDTRLETSIARVNGVARVDGGLDRFGTSVDDGTINRAADVTSIVDLVAEGTRGGLDAVESTGDVELDASVASINQSGRQATLDVGTLGNWTTGDYRWVYLAAGDDSRDLYVQTDTLQVREETRSDPGGGGGGGDDSDDDDNDDDDDDSSDDDSDGDDDGDGVDCEGESRPSLTVSKDRATGSIECLNESDHVQLDLGLATANGSTGVNFERLNFTAASSARDVTATITSSAERPENVSASPVGNRVIGYLSTEFENLESVETTEGELTVNVTAPAVTDGDGGPDDLVVSRYADGSWERLNTTHVNGTVFRADTVGLSTFAVGTPAPALTVTDASVDETEIEPGGSVDVTATVENTGTASGSKTLVVTANGADRTNVTVEADPGTAATETTALRFDEAGTYDVAVDGVSAGTVTVAAATDEPTPTPTPGEAAGGGLLPLVLVGAALALVAIVVSVLYGRS